MTLHSMRSHLTDRCDHDVKSYCERCEFGCMECGVNEEEHGGAMNDDGLCMECAQSRAELAADMIYESMKYGDGA